MRENTTILMKNGLWLCKVRRRMKSKLREQSWMSHKFGEDQINESYRISLDGIAIPGYASKIRFGL